MDSKYAPKIRRPAAVSIMDGQKLAKFRKRVGLSLMEVAKLSKISKSTLSAYENGHAVPPLHRLIILCQIYDLYLFEVTELLRLNVIQAKMLKAFRGACKKDNKTPRQAIEEFLLVYTHIVNSAQKS